MQGWVHAGFFKKGFPLRIDDHVLKGSLLFLWQTTAGCYNDVSLEVSEAKLMWLLSIYLHSVIAICIFLCIVIFSNFVISVHTLKNQKLFYLLWNKLPEVINLVAILRRKLLQNITILHGFQPVIGPGLLCSKFYLLCFWAVLTNRAYYAQN